MNGARQKAKHATGTLEGAQGSGFLREHFEELRVERIAANELVPKFGIHRIGGERLSILLPDLTIVVNCGAGGG